MDALKELDLRAAESASIRFDPDCSGGLVEVCAADRAAVRITGPCRREARL